MATAKSMIRTGENDYTSTAMERIWSAFFLRKWERLEEATANLTAEPSFREGASPVIADPSPKAVHNVLLRRAVELKAENQRVIRTRQVLRISVEEYSDGFIA